MKKIFLCLSDEHIGHYINKQLKQHTVKRKFKILEIGSYVEADNYTKTKKKKEEE